MEQKGDEKERKGDENEREGEEKGREGIKRNIRDGMWRGGHGMEREGMGRD